MSDHPAWGQHTLMCPPSYSYGYLQSIITHSLMKLANFPVSTDTICREHPRVQLFHGVLVLFPHPHKGFSPPSLQHIPFQSQCILNPDVSQRRCGINNPVRQTALTEGTPRGSPVGDGRGQRFSVEHGHFRDKNLSSKAPELKLRVLQRQQVIVGSCAEGLW